MTKTQRILTAVALAAGASAMAVSGASAAVAVDEQTTGGSTSLGQLDQLNELNQLNQLMTVPQHLAPLLDPVAQVAGAIQ
ncbi:MULTISPECIES: hypothetical protein [unclassified Streptomyces]|uniref:hypothetical protein n=1 Tax=unclassified Streptomyces TaxID=2593676 RepID=UPI002E2B986A|nr:hypothetical protein [Streptomyces sp. NBC_00690]